MKTAITREEFDALVRPLKGMSASQCHLGYPRSLSVELGNLHQEQRGKYKFTEGEASIGISSSWRIENGSEVVVGSLDSMPKLDEQIGTIKNLNVTALTLQGDLLEIVVGFSNGLRLRSMKVESIVDWAIWGIKLTDGTWLSCENGALTKSQGNEVGPGLSPEETRVCDYAEATAKRWGEPRVEPIGGHCWDCEFVIRLDGDFHLLDYGACTAENGPLDGRVVNCDSGCPAFTRAVDEQQESNEQ